MSPRVPIPSVVRFTCTAATCRESGRSVRSDDGFAVAREHSKGDCAIRGPASDILLALWRRVPLSTCDVVGDADVAARFIAHTNLD